MSMTEQEKIIREGFASLGHGHYDALVSVIATDATITCPIYGQMHLTDFFKLFLKDTLFLKTTITKITHEHANASIFVTMLAFDWTLKEGKTISGESKVALSFDTDTKIKEVVANYTFHKLS